MTTNPEAYKGYRNPAKAVLIELGVEVWSDVEALGVMWRRTEMRSGPE